MLYNATREHYRVKLFYSNAENCTAVASILKKKNLWKKKHSKSAFNEQFVFYSSTEKNVKNKKKLNTFCKESVSISERYLQLKKIRKVSAMKKK